MKIRYALLLAAVWGSLVHLLGAPIARGLWGTSVSWADASWFFVPFSALPLVAFVGVALVILRQRPDFPPLRWAARAGVAMAAALSLAAQVICWKELPTDAQAALLFLFLPGLSVLVSGLLTVVVFVLGLLLNLIKRRRAAPAT